MYLVSWDYSSFTKYSWKFTAITEAKSLGLLQNIKIINLQLVFVISLRSDILLSILEMFQVKFYV